MTHRGHARFIKIFNVIRRKPMIATDQLRSTQQRQLLDMPFDRNARRLRRAQYPLALRQGKAHALTEQIDRFKQPLFP